MTNDKMFDEIGCPDELKKCKAEINVAILSIFFINSPLNGGGDGELPPMSSLLS